MVVIVVAAVLRSWQQRMWYRGSATPVTGLTALMWVVVKCSAVEAIVVEVDPDEADPPDEAGLSRGARRRLTGRWLTTRGGASCRIRSTSAWAGGDDEERSPADGLEELGANDRCRFCYFADLGRARASLAATLRAFVRCGVQALRQRIWIL
uniref:Uncharacterized protein n=1 Tax=Oryza rufipogon TaxID=4529 RepID=A0A0E0P800_ORYRU